MPVVDSPAVAAARVAAAVAGVTADTIPDGASKVVMTAAERAKLVNAPADVTSALAAKADTTVVATKVNKGDLTFNVRDFGAIGDGVTDDTAAIQAAANAACARKGTLFFPGGYTYMVNPGVTNVTGTSYVLIVLSGTCTVKIETGATVKVMPSTTPFYAIFGADSWTRSLSGTLFMGGGTIDANSAMRRAAKFVPSDTYPCKGISRITVTHGLTITNLRFTDFDSVWCISVSSSGRNNLSNVEVSHCQFDNLGNYDPTCSHDFSAIYIDAVGIKVHHNTFWEGAPGATTFSTNYGARTAIELHGSSQVCHDNESYGLQWGGNLWTSYNCWQETDLTGSRNAVGVTWSNNKFMYCAVGINLGAGVLSGNYYGLAGVSVHDNQIVLNPSAWNVETGGGVYCNGIVLAHGAQVGTVRNISICRNNIRLSPNNNAMNTFTFVSGPMAKASHITMSLLFSGASSTLSDITIADNILEGSCQDGIHLNAYAFDGISVTNNLIRNAHTVAGGTGYGVYVGTTATVSANFMYNTRIQGNDCYDDQRSTNNTYGYTGQTLMGVVLANAGVASNARVLDNGYHCRSTATVKVADQFVGAPAPFLRAIDHGPTFVAPGGFWAAGSTVTLVGQLNAVAPIPAVYVQTATNHGSGSGNTWVRQPIPGLGSIMTKTAAYTAISGDILLVDASTGAVTITSPPLAPGAEFTVKKIDSSANAVTITAASSTIDGTNNKTLSAQWASMRIRSDGTYWFAF